MAKEAHFMLRLLHKQNYHHDTNPHRKVSAHWWHVYGYAAKRAVTPHSEHKWSESRERFKRLSERTRVITASFEMQLRSRPADIWVGDVGEAFCRQTVTVVTF